MQGTTRKRPASTSRMLKALAFLTPAAVMILIFVFYPVLRTVQLGFQNFNLFDQFNVGYNGLQNFRNLIDDVFESNTSLISRISLLYDDYIIFISSEEEPKTTQVDTLVEDIILKTKAIPSGIIGIGGGTVMDLAKSVSVMLTNNGSSEEYQGWDLLKYPGVYHVGVPTISGTGAEVSRTAVLSGSKLKLGLNSDFTPFDQVILHSE